MSARTHHSFLSPSLSGAPPPAARKLRKEERDRGGNVLPQLLGSSSMSIRGDSYASGSNGVMRSSDRTATERSGHLAPRIQATIASAKERRTVKKDGISRRNMVVDEDGVAHDSEYVQFRTATPVHLHSQRAPTALRLNADDSASSSGSSSSSDNSSSRFPSAPYTYQSTHRTANSHYSNQPTTASAIPSYLNTKPVRSSLDYPGSSLTAPRAPSPRTSGDYDRNRDYDRAGGYSSKPSSKMRSLPPAQFTTSSYQPPAPAFQPRAMDYTGSLRLPPKPLSSNSNSITDSVAKMSLADNGGSGYNQFASSRPPKLDGTVMDAGVHGLKRSWDGFKLEVKFGAHKASNKVARKILNL